MEAKIAKSIADLCGWLERHGNKAYDPGDGQFSFLRFLAFNQPFLKRLLTAGVLRAPFNIRPWIGIKPHMSTKGMGYIAWGYSKLYAQTHDSRYAERAKACLQWLNDNPSPGHAQFCWGNDFAFSTRGGTIPAFEPTIVWSGLIGQAFLEAYKVFGDMKYLEVAASICDWILTLPREKTDTGTCISYVGFFQSSIHNSSMLGAALLAQVGMLTGNGKFVEVAKEAMIYSCSRMLPDGAWYYGEHPKYHWIDNFHTGYNLDSLKRYNESTGDQAFAEHLRRGFDYYKRTFFEENGRPKYYHNKSHPIDIQCAAQSIDTLTFFSAGDPDALEMAQKVATWTIHNFQARDGHFYYRDMGWFVNRTPMLHWGQGTMLKALAHLQGSLQSLKNSARVAAMAEAAK
jgi:rhamnogalacturonyl hydrolase YesR